MKSMRLGFLLLTLAACSRFTGPNATPPLANAASSRTKASPSGYQTVFSFNGTNGAQPVAGLIAASGVLYGDAVKGGAYGGGTVFSLTPSGSPSALHNFGASTYDGAGPGATLAIMKGTLYGITLGGGKPPKGFGCTGGCGTIFAVSAAGKERTVYNFGPTTFYPNSPLVPFANVLYGTAGGVVYSATASGGESMLHRFKGYPDDGEGPHGGLLLVNGVLYGTTGSGGANKLGTVFSMTPAGKESLLYSFKGVPDGRYPHAGLIDVNGTLYGTTESGGSGSCRTRRQPRKPVILGCGTIFEITTSGAEKVIYSFPNKTAGAYPEAGLVAVNGALYGTTSSGGAYNNSGTVFSVTSSGSQSVLHSFGKGSDGSEPLAGLVDVNGTLYGTTASGGAYHNGTVFAITP